MSKESYRPSPREIEKAEDMMSHTQRKLSWARERFLGRDIDPEKLEKSGVKLTYQHRQLGPGSHENMIYGKISGHKVEIKKIVYLSEYSGHGFRPDRSEVNAVQLSGHIDGIPLGEENAEKLWDKYIDLAERQKEYDYKVERIESEKTDEERREEKIARKRWLEEKRAGMQGTIKDFLEKDLYKSKGK